MLPHGIVVLFHEYKQYKTRKTIALNTNSYENVEGDIILSLGPSCRVAHYLSVSGLRYCSSPLDWMMDYSLETAAHFFKTGFEDFFEEIIIDKENKRVEDKRNHIVSMHHFKINNNINREQRKFHTMMLRRYSRIDKIIKQSGNIVFVSNRNEEISILCGFIEEISKIYDKNYTFINIRDNRDIDDMKYYEKNISDRIKIMEYEFKDVHKDGEDRKTNSNFWIGNTEKWNVIMRNIKLSDAVNFLTYLKSKNYVMS